MRMLLFLTAWLCTGCLASAVVSDPTAVLAEGNTLYHAGEFEQAVGVYQQLLPEHQSASIHYNLGNAFYRLGDFGPAILHYEKALALSPRNPDIRANLELAQEAAEVSPIDGSWAHVLTEWLSVNGWALIAVVSFWVSAALIILAPLYRWRGMLRGVSTTVGVITFVVSVIGLYGWHVRASYGVVLSDGVTLSVAPTTSSPPAGSVKSGEAARIREEHGNYYLVSVGEDKIGWLSKESFAPIWDS